MFMLMLEFSKRTQDSSVVSLIQPSEMLWPLQALQRETDHCQYPLATPDIRPFTYPGKQGSSPSVNVAPLSTISCQTHECMLCIPELLAFNKQGSHRESR